MNNTSEGIDGELTSEPTPPLFLRRLMSEGMEVLLARNAGSHEP
jgi:hypothetical protein